MPAFPAIPKNPATIGLNQWLTTRFFKSWFSQYLSPPYSYRITSQYRTPEKNKEVGGVENSAHLYGLAVDFVLTDPAGNPIDPDIVAGRFEETIKPTWPGVAINEGSHIHLHLDRDITNATKWVGLAAAAAGIGFVITRAGRPIIRSETTHKKR